MPRGLFLMVGLLVLAAGFAFARAADLDHHRHHPAPETTTHEKTLLYCTAATAKRGCVFG